MTINFSHYDNQPNTEINAVNNAEINTEHGLMHNDESLNVNTPAKSLLFPSALAYKDLSQFESKRVTSKFSNDNIVSLTKHRRLPIGERKGWACNVSQLYKFSNVEKTQIQINTQDEKHQFELIVKLLKANTCRVIYFDANLDKTQLEYLRSFQSRSGTELINAKIIHKLNCMQRAYN